MNRIELTRIAHKEQPQKAVTRNLAVFIVMLVGYIFAILAGLIGTPVGSHSLYRLSLDRMVGRSSFSSRSFTPDADGAPVFCPIRCRGMVAHAARSYHQINDRNGWISVCQNVPQYLDARTFLVLRLSLAVPCSLPPNITGIVTVRHALSQSDWRHLRAPRLLPLSLSRGWIHRHILCAHRTAHQDKQVCVKCVGKPYQRRRTRTTVRMSAA